MLASLRGITPINPLLLTGLARTGKRPGFIVNNYRKTETKDGQT